MTKQFTLGDSLLTCDCLSCRQPGLEVGQRCPIQCRLDKRRGESMVRVRRCAERHSAPPTFGSLRMNPGENDPAIAEPSLNDCRSSIRVFCDDRAPPG